MSLPNDVPGVPSEAMLLVDYDKSDVGETHHHMLLVESHPALCSTLQTVCCEPQTTSDTSSIRCADLCCCCCC
jgi:hypothetical protein